MCRYFCVELIEFALKGKSFLFSPNECEKNDKIIINILNNSKLKIYFRNRLCKGGYKYEWRQHK